MEYRDVGGVLQEDVEAEKKEQRFRECVRLHLHVLCNSPQNCKADCIRSVSLSLAAFSKRAVACACVCRTVLGLQEQVEELVQTVAQERAKRERLEEGLHSTTERLRNAAAQARIAQEKHQEALVRAFWLQQKLHKTLKRS